MKEKPAADRRVNALMRKKTLEALEESGVTRYGLCRALRLNKGNVYAYLAGDDSKVSRKTARRIMEYVEERGAQEGAGRPVCGGVRLIAVLIDDRLGLLGGVYVCN